MNPLDLAVRTKCAIEDGAWPALFLPLQRNDAGKILSWHPERLPGSDLPFRDDAVSILGRYMELERRVLAANQRLEDPAFGHRIMSRREIGRILDGRDPESGEDCPPAWTFSWQS